MDDEAPDRISPYDANAWTAFAACRDRNPAAFFMDSPVAVEFAKGICHDCPVAAQCLDRALRTNEAWGVWGGLSADERKQLKRREARATWPSNNRRTTDAP
jgi:WhiB family redox-sensing transcriptional regulator